MRARSVRLPDASFLLALRILLVMIVTLMALGAGVRTMNAGLSCPDWPLCFGKVIPDFHPGTWFEFVHRAYAGLVTLVFLGCAIYAYRNARLPRGARLAALFGLVTLAAQIIMGGLTVLLLVKSVIVTAHLMLATLFFVSVLMMYFTIEAGVERAPVLAPKTFPVTVGLLVGGVFMQMLLGGFVASTYAGSVCVDWPLCNGQWVPTWGGAIGLQITHRFVAYFLAIALLAYAVALQSLANSQHLWVTKQILRLSRWSVVLVFVQVGLGIANLLLYIPPSITVLHQSVAVILLAVNLRAFYFARLLARPSQTALTPEHSEVRARPEYPAEHRELHV